MSTAEYLSIDRCESLLWLRLDRADKANALTVGMMEGATAEARAGMDEHHRNAK